MSAGDEDWPERAGISDEVSMQFLSAEYELVAGLRWNNVEAFQTGMSRVIGLNTAAIGGLIFFATSDGRTVGEIGFATGTVGLLLSVVNHNLARRAVSYQISTRRYLRALNLLRGFFVSRDHSISSAISMPTDPSFPPMTHFGPGPGIWGGPQGEAVGLAAISLAVMFGGWALVLQSLFSVSDAVGRSVGIAVGFFAAWSGVLYWNNRSAAAFRMAESGDSQFYADSARSSLRVRRVLTERLTGESPNDDRGT